MHLRLFLDHFWPQKSQIAYCLTGSLLTGSLARGQLMQQLQLCQKIDTKRTVALSAGGLVINISKNILTGVTLGRGPILANGGLTLLQFILTNKYVSTRSQK